MILTISLLLYDVIVEMMNQFSVKEINNRTPTERRYAI